MTSTDLISQILTATKNPLNPVDYKDKYREWSMIIHPDKCTDVNAQVAFDRLTKFRDELEFGMEFTDEISTITMKGNLLTFVGDMQKLSQSYENYLKISDRLKSHSTFKFYLPESMTLFPDRLEVTLRDNVDGYFQHSVYLGSMGLAEKHTKWFLNRMLEFSSLLNITGGYTHCGIGPSSVLICPETHGIQVISFYHSVPANSPLKSLNGTVKNWYPASVFSTKKANESIDLELCKRFACTLMGDPSGLGTKLKGSIDDSFATFLLTAHPDIRTGYMAYQEFIDKSPRTFHTLDL